RSEIPVVRCVVPGEHLRRHALVEQRLGEPERLAGLLGVEEHVLPRGVALLSAEAREERPPVEVRVVAVGELDPAWVPLRLQGPRGDAYLNWRSLLASF